MFQRKYYSSHRNGGHLRSFEPFVVFFKTLTFKFPYDKKKKKFRKKSHDKRQRRYNEAFFTTPGDIMVTVEHFSTKHLSP